MGTMKQNGSKWLTLALLSGAFFFHQADRALFGLLTIPIQDELHLTDLQIGWINTALFCTLAVTTPFAGVLGDRFSRKWIITFSLLFWSLMTACTGFVGGICGLVFFRSIATGGGESFYTPSAFALLAEHHKETRGIAFSVHQSALYVGLMLSGALVAWALHLFGGWRPVFIAFGGMGFLLGVVFCFALKDKAPAAAGGGPPARGRFADAAKAVFCNPAALCAMLGYMAMVFTNNAYMSWAPKFMAQKFPELTLGAAGFGTMFWHYAAALAAIIAGGVVTDRVVKRAPKYRLLLQGTATLLGAPLVAAFGFAPSVVAAWAAIAVWGAFRGFIEVNTHPSLFDVVEPRFRATAEGLVNFVVFLVGSLSPLMLGALSDAYGVRGFEVGFAVLACTYVVGALALFVSYAFFFTSRKVEE